VMTAIAIAAVANDKFAHGCMPLAQIKRCSSAKAKDVDASMDHSTVIQLIERPSNFLDHTLLRRPEVETAQ